MVGVFKELQRGALSKPRDQWPKLLQLSEIVARALQKEHRDCHVQQVLGALD
jgi:hypothetical protein